MVYEDDVLDAVRAQLATLDGVLVWVNPIHEGRNRANLDALLREVAARGVWVSAHPDVILKMGTKEVLHRTRTMSWGCDTALYRTAEAMRAELPARLAAGPRVIKRNRGNGGQGVWKVETLASPGNRPMVRVLDATKDASEELALDEFLERCAEYFEDGCVIDQPFQARLREGVVRCYMAGDRCAGFGHQKVKALVDAPAARAEAGPAALHLQCRSALPAPAPVDGRRVDTAADLLAGHPAARPADDLGRGLHARPAAAPTGPTATCLAKSTSVRCSQSPTRRRQRSPAGLPIGCGRSFEWSSHVRMLSYGPLQPKRSQRSSSAHGHGSILSIHTRSTVSSAHTSMPTSDSGSIQTNCSRNSTGSAFSFSRRKPIWK